MTRVISVCNLQVLHDTHTPDLDIFITSIVDVATPVDNPPRTRITQNTCGTCRGQPLYECMWLRPYWSSSFLGVFPVTEQHTATGSGRAFGLKRSQSEFAKKINSLFSNEPAWLHQAAAVWGRFAISSTLVAKYPRTSVEPQTGKPVSVCAARGTNIGLGSRWLWLSFSGFYKHPFYQVSWLRKSPKTRHELKTRA